MAQSKNPIRAVETSISILEVVKRQDGARVTDITRELDLTKGAIYNHLSTLEDHGFIVKEGQQYNVGLRFFEFGEYAKDRQQVLHVGRDRVDDLARETNKLVNLLVEENGMGIYLYRTEEHSELSHKTLPGTHVHLHYTAVGKAILAHIPDQRVEEILDRHGLPARTDNTITDRAALNEELDRIRDEGVAFDREESVDNIKCVAAPIRTASGRVLGGISVTGLKGRMEGDYFESELPKRITEAASVIGINAAAE